MLKRRIEERILNWKQKHSDVALVVAGARQVGKTHTLTHFIESTYHNAVSVDLVADPKLASALNQAGTAQEMMALLTAAGGVHLVPGEPVIFVDEVQQAPNIVTQIKYLVQEYPYDFILSGSLLGVELENIASIPVGYVHTLYMYPLDFEEFCWANGIASSTSALVKEAIEAEKPIPHYIHEKLVDLFKTYLVVGGMPAVVDSYVEKTDIQAVRTIQKDIVSQYRADISKYAPRDRHLVIRNIDDLIPSELAKESRRFRINSIDGVKRFSSIADEFLWLTAAGGAISIPQVTAPVSPLVMQQTRGKFKFFSSDVGLLSSVFSDRVTLDILSIGSTNLGGLYENFVARELIAHGRNPFYFSKHNVGELDFLVEEPGGDLIALEVKSGAGYLTHRALDNALATKGYGIDRAVVVGPTGVEVEGRISYLPIYAVSWLPIS